ncbi:MAG TPA: heparinase II/III family protein, partial [Candidatus Synoicihabitans sp.]|nr:heparinase II/III family protein [Candidatus Synoicihabitans sp.]
TVPGNFTPRTLSSAGSFILFHRGRPLLIDSGKCGYDRAEYMDYYVRSRAHNVVLFDGEGQPAEDNVRGVKFPGTVQRVVEGEGLRYVRADATGPMAHVFSRNYRHWLWLGRVILVIDDVRAHRDGRFDWLLHYAGEAQASGDGVRIVNGDAAARIRFLNPPALERTTERGWDANQPDVERAFLRFSTPTPAREAKFLTAIVLEEAGQPQPQLELLEGPDFLGVRVTQSDVVVETWLNLLADGRTAHLNSINLCGPWTTDAYLLATIRSAGDAEIDSVLIVDGSLLRKDERSVWESYGKITGFTRLKQVR